MNNLLNGLIVLSTSTGLNKDIYTQQSNNLTIAIKSIIKMVGGIGGLCFTLAVLIIALFIIFGSISPKNIGRWWTALFSCVGGAALFFSAFLLSDVIANMFSK